MTRLTFTRALTAGEAHDFHRAIWFDRPDGAGVSSLVIMRWLADPAVHDAVVAACPPGTLPLQTRQAHRPCGRITVGSDYQVSVHLEEQDEPNARRVKLRYLVSLDDRAVSEGEIEFICVPADRAA